MSLKSAFSIFFKSTSTVFCTSLFTGGTFCYKNLKNFHEYLIKHYLNSGGIKGHFRQVKVPGTTPYWTACYIIKKVNLLWFLCSNFYITSFPELATQIKLWPLLLIWFQSYSPLINFKSVISAGSRHVDNCPPLTDFNSITNLIIFCCSEYSFIQILWLKNCWIGVKQHSFMVFKYIIY